MDQYISNPNYQPRVDRVTHMSGAREVFSTILKIFLYSLPVIIFIFPFMVLIFRSSLAYSLRTGH